MGDSPLSFTMGDFTMGDLPLSFTIGDFTMGDLPLSFTMGDFTEIMETPLQQLDFARTNNFTLGQTSLDFFHPFTFLHIG
jgi:hypothetical protein